jgi:Holliday junction resolvase RusA-like endonuclease
MPCAPVETPVSVRVDIYKGVPKSWSKAKRARALDGQEIPGKPDLDNVAKGVLDAMNGVAYVDDTPVIRLLVQKQYSLEPRLVVTVKEMLE